MPLCSALIPLALVPPPAPEPDPEGLAQSTLALFLLIVGVIVLFLVAVLLLRLAFRVQRTKPDSTARSLQVDAWKEAGERAEGFDQHAEPDG